MATRMTWRWLATLTLATAMVACTEEMPKGDPSDYVKEGRFGLGAPSAVALDVSANAHWMQRLVSGFSKASVGDPSEVKIINSIPNCVFSPPLKEEKIVFLTTKDGAHSDKFYYFSNENIQIEAQKFVNEWQKKGSAPEISVSDHDFSVDIVTVVVTDTSAPIHIVLGSWGNIIFNFQVADGVELAAVTMIGAAPIGAANLPDKTRIQAMAPKVAASCKVDPVLKPTANSSVAREAKTDAGIKDVLTSITTRHHRFNDFFRRNFGTESYPVTVGGESVSSMLIGPAPSDLKQRSAFKSLQGSTIHMINSGTLIVGSRSDYKKAFRQSVMDASAKFVVGPLSSLNKK